MALDDLRRIALAALIAVLGVGCSSSDDDNDDDPGPEQTTRSPDLAVITRIDDVTGFLVAVDSKNDTQIDNSKGIELTPSTGLFTYDDKVYTTGSLANDFVSKYSLNGDVFEKEGEFQTGEGARAGSIIFVNDTKAYVNTLNTPELLIFNPSTMEKTGSIDLTTYALGEDDTNPNASSGVIVDEKLYLALGQIDTVQTWKCQGGASVVIINIASDTVEKHIQDDRACLSGTLEPNGGLIVDEIGDIYINHLASYGYYSGLNAGFLRIKSGAEEFDPDYFFSFTDLQFPEAEAPGGIVSYLYREIYDKDGMVYGNFFVPGLSSDPPDYVNDRQYLAYKIDLRNQTVTKLDIPATSGWSADSIVLDDQVLFGRMTDSGAGIYRYDPSSGTDIGDQTPFLPSEGSPVWMAPL